jgi:hypothetical protein
MRRRRSGHLLRLTPQPAEQPRQINSFRVRTADHVWRALTVNSPSVCSCITKLQRANVPRRFVTPTPKQGSQLDSVIIGHYALPRIGKTSSRSQQF